MAPPRIARFYGASAVAVGLLGVYAMATPAFRNSPTGLYALPAIGIALTPPLLLVYLGTKVMRGERMAVYALTAMAAICAAGVLAFDQRRGSLLLLTVVVILAPLVWAASRHPESFR